MTGFDSKRTAALDKLAQETVSKDEALKLALEAFECLKRDFDADQFEWGIADEAITAIKEALAQPEQEPVAWMFQHEETGRMNYVSNDGIHTPTMFLGMNPRYAFVCPLYTTPPKREWVGLTDEEIEQGCKESWVTEQAWQSAVWWAEAKLKVKNYGRKT